jgi:hypothetical protein
MSWSASYYNPRGHPLSIQSAPGATSPVPLWQRLLGRVAAIPEGAGVRVWRVSGRGDGPEGDRRRRSFVLPILQTLSTIISFAQLVPADVDVRPDGTLTGSRVLLDMASADPGVPDGLKVDVHGNVFCTGPGGV